MIIWQLVFISVMNACFYAERQCLVEPFGIFKHKPYAAMACRAANFIKLFNHHIAGGIIRHAVKISVNGISGDW